MNSPVEPIYSTQSYSYNNLQLTGGLGYQKKMRNDFLLNIACTYNWLNSFTQKYVVNKEYGTEQHNNKSIPIGHTINVSSGISKNISKNISIGLDLILPVYTHWKDDIIFYKYDYADDTQIIARTKFSLGANLSFFYQLKQ